MSATDVLASVRAHLAQFGEELDAADELTQEMEGRAAPRPAAEHSPPPAEQVWLSPADADIRYRDVLIVKAASKKIYLVVITNYRRPGKGKRKGWKR